MSDKIKSLNPTPVDFYPGEEPTDVKLEGIAREQQQAVEFIEYALGDLYGYNNIKPWTWSNNIARDIGDRDKLSPSYEPGVVISSYVQQLPVGKTTYELDLIPIGSGATIVSTSTDSAIVPSQYRASVSLLNAVGDWTIPSGTSEQGLVKNSRRLITYAPTTGGTITFASVTSGKGDSYYYSKHNVIPSFTQANSGGPFCSVVLLSAVNNTYEITLPLNNLSYNRIYGSAPTTISNTVPGLDTGRRYELPSYLFDPTGLDLFSDDPITGVGKIYPLGSLRIYDFDSKGIVDGLVQIQAATSQVERKYKIICTFGDGVLLAPSTGHYCVVCSGTSISELLSVLRNELFNHTHSGDDQIRQLTHSDLMNLRTGTTFSNISEWYGASNISNNDHSQYLHRNGLSLSDSGAGYNIMRGSLLIGSSTSGSGVPNYHLQTDSFQLLFGTSAGPSLLFDKVYNHSIPYSHGGISSHSSEALVINGANNGSKNTVIVPGEFRVDGNTVLGTTASSNVIVPGQVYVDNALVLRPRSDKPTAETGQLIYDSVLKAPTYYDGNAWKTLGLFPYSAIVGSLNGCTHSDLQSAINAVSAGARILIVSSLTLTSTTNVNKNSLEIECISPEIIITGGNFVGLNVTGLRCHLNKLNLRSFTGPNARGIYINGEGCILSNSYFDPANTYAFEIGSSITNFKHYGCMEY